MELKELIDELKRIKEEVPYSVNEVAKKLCMHFRTITKILHEENPRVTARTVRKIKDFVFSYRCSTEQKEQ